MYLYKYAQSTMKFYQQRGIEHENNNYLSKYINHIKRNGF